MIAPSTKICQTWIVWVDTNSARPSAVSAEIAWMTNITLRRSIRSDMMPPRMKKLNNITMRSELNNPRYSGDEVRSKSNQPWAMPCIQEPTLETK